MYTLYINCLYIVYTLLTVHTIIRKNFKMISNGIYKFQMLNKTRLEIFTHYTSLIKDMFD